MSRTLTKYFTFLPLKDNLPQSQTLIRLMMVCNDIIISNQCLTEFPDKLPPIKKHLSPGAKMYFTRLQCGHLNEARKIVLEIHKDNKLLSFLDKCSNPAKEGFNQLYKCSLKDTKEYQLFRKRIEIIRHTMIFHYDPELTTRAITRLGSKYPYEKGKITMGDEYDTCRFEIADQILDSATCRYIWKIPEGSNLKEETNKIALWGSELCKSFVQFGIEYSWRYLEAIK